MNARRGFLGAAAAVLSMPAAATRGLGEGRGGAGTASPFEKTSRLVTAGYGPATGASRTPLADIYGSLTPAGLHFERHHSGIPSIDPATHELLLHGLVERPLRFSMAELKRLPSVSRMHFIECAGNTAMDHAGRPGATPQISHGLVSNSEWTGVPLKLLIEEAGLLPGAAWIEAEGADASRMNRSIPLAKAMDDVIVAYAQNGEAIRPAQGYPLRLLVPGWEGNVSIKWLHRLNVVRGPVMSRDEAAFYTDLLPDGRARQFTFEMDVKSVITRPAGGQSIAKGFHDITGLAWSGRGRIAKVEISTDGGATWQRAALLGAVHDKAVTRFRLPWRWDGGAVTLASRAYDDSGAVQPTREEIIAARGMKATDHYNGIKSWRIGADGVVTHV